MRERQEFAFEAAVRMRDRFLQQEVWERMGVDVKPIVHGLLNVPPEGQRLPAAAVLQDRAQLQEARPARRRRRLAARPRSPRSASSSSRTGADTGEEYETLDDGRQGPLARAT